MRLRQLEDAVRLDITEANFFTRARMRTIPAPYVNTRKAEELFRHRVLRLLKDKGLLSEERIKLLLSWRRSGFSIDDSVRIPAGEQQMLERVARYMLRAPVSLSRVRWARGDSEVLYAAKTVSLFYLRASPW